MSDQWDTEPFEAENIPPGYWDLLRAELAAAPLADFDESVNLPDFMAGDD